jgi:hypothetical protein
MAVPDRRDRRGDVVDPFFDIEGVEQLEGALPLGFGLVGDVDARLDAPEQIRADRDEALRGKTAGPDPPGGVAR